jgi:hypothetical protein
LIDLSTATEDDIVLVLSEAHGTLGLIYHTIGITSVSTDEYFCAVQYKRYLKKYNERKKEREELEKRKQIELKAKQIDTT